MKKQRIIVGAVVEINLGDEVFCYGQILSKAEVVFFDKIGSRISVGELNSLLDSEALFIISVSNSAINSGRWVVVGKLPVKERFLFPRRYYVQDRHSGECFLYFSDTGVMASAPCDELVGLECAAVWDAQHVEDRLRDHHDGRPNVWLDQLRIKNM